LQMLFFSYAQGMLDQNHELSVSVQVVSIKWTSFRW
jgi:hypothetical protein